MIYFKNILFLVFLILNSSCSKSNQILDKPDSYIISFVDSSSYKTAKICYDDFKTKINSELVAFKSFKEVSLSKKVQIIVIEVDPDLSSDVNILQDEERVHIFGKTSNATTWLFSQYLKKISTVDNRINTDNIPSIEMSFDSIKNLEFAFEYREPFFKPNLVLENNRIFGTNNLETDWGIWGHNFGKLLSKNPKNTYFSTVNGDLDKNQICFSSKETYGFLETYILDNFGYGNAEYSVNFTIVPNDNSLVCTCQNCKNLGNTNKDATPSVVYFIKKIAEKFPNHSFFTIDYLTVQSATKEKLPKNTGVFVSAIDVPNSLDFQIKEQQKVNEFEQKIYEWKKIVPKVYVWDYASNFDDYLAPFPNLFMKQKHLNFYNRLGVKGVFFNGSGYAYSSFEDLKTYVFSVLLMNPKVNIKSLVTQFYKQNYPVTGSKIASYVLSMEQKLESSKKSLNLYGGIDEALQSYLDEKEFFDFYNYLLLENKSLTNEEKINIDKLIVALTFTKLQISLHNGAQENGYIQFNNKKEASIKSEYINSLKYFDKNVSQFKIEDFKETQGRLIEYINEVKTIVLNTNNIDNKLLFKKLEILSKLDEDYRDISKLTDGIKGISLDYHTNWLFFTAEDLEFKLPEISQKNKNELQMSFLCNKKMKIFPPTKIEIFENDKLIKTNKIVYKGSDPERLVIKTQFTTSGNTRIKVKVLRDNINNKIACDEITLQ
jgi:hypothetical protein